ncbi:MAG: hypothetical protein LBL17_01560 [Coxiellaceae bacterium]|jgi:RNA polymerase nonessential primary-like sigma factor|nr:hypothetical protein [Coxiellaceae bacterium]
MVSLDASISEEGKGNSFSDLTIDENNIDPARQMQFEAMIYLVDMWLSKLEGLQSEVIARRFGLRGYEKSTLEAISEVMQINLEKVRQIQNVGLRGLRKMMQDQGILRDVIS